jgi:hypothetical protein
LQALEHAGRERAMRSELSQAFAAVLANLATPRKRSEEETRQLVSLATLVSVARSAVERDGYSRDIELIPEAEAPTRLAIVLDRLLGGLDAIGCDRRQAFTLITKVALDSVPALRLALLSALLEGTKDTNELIDAVRHPRNTTYRTLEDLNAHSLVTYERQGQNKPHLWTLTPFAAERLACFPEVSIRQETLFISRSASSTTNRGNGNKPPATGNQEPKWATALPTSSNGHVLENEALEAAARNAWLDELELQKLDHHASEDMEGAR